MTNEMIDRVSFEMKRYQLESHVDGTFFIQDGYTDAVVREELTAADEPMDIVDEMNARAVILAMREPTEAMKNITKIVIEDLHRYQFTTGKLELEIKLSSVWRNMIDEALK